MKMNTMKQGRLLFVGIIFVLFFAACDTPVLNAPPQITDSGETVPDVIVRDTGRVVVGLKKSVGRTILPETPEFSSYLVQFEYLDESGVQKDNQIENTLPCNVDLKPGKWRVTVTGRVTITGVAGILDGEYPAAVGSAEVTVNSGQTVSVTVDLASGTDIEGQGVLEYEIGLPEEGLGGAVLRVLKMDTTEVASRNLNETSSGSVALDAGYYLLQVEVGTGRLRVKTELVYIYSGHTARAAGNAWNFNTQEGDTFISVLELSEFLDSVPANTVDTPYRVKLNVNIETLADTTRKIDPLGVIFNILKGKYIALDLSGSEGSFKIDEAHPLDYNYYYWNSGAVDRDKLTAVVLPESVKSIPPCTFSYCVSLKSINFPAALEQLGQVSFYQCSVLESADLSACSFTAILPSTFYRCFLLKEVLLPDSLQRIDGFAFYGTNSLEELAFPSSLQSIGNESFIYSDIKKADFSACASLTTIAPEVFARCDLLETIIFPRSTNLNSIAIDGLPSLKEIDISGCTALESLKMHACAVFTNLELSGLVNLKTVELSNLPVLSELDLSSSIALDSFKISNCAVFTNLELSGAALKTAEFTNCPALVTCDFSDCAALESLKLTDCAAFETLNLSGLEHLAAVDLSGCTQLTSLNLTGCITLDSLKLINCAVFTNLELSDCGLKTAEFTNCPALVNCDFSDCTAFESLKLADCAALETFNLSGCAVLKTAELANCSALVNCDFSPCAALESLKLTDCAVVKTLNFSGLAQLKTVTAPNHTALEQVNLSGCAALTSVDFSGCSALTAVSLPSSFNVNVGAFSGCAKAVFTVPAGGTLSVDVSGKVLQIGSTIVAWPSAADTITIPEGITAINSGVFDDNISAIVFPESLTNIANIVEALKELSSLQTLDFSACTLITTAGNSTFTGVILPEAGVILPSTIVDTGGIYNGSTTYSAFYESSFKSIDLSACTDITNIDIQNCAALETLKLPVLDSFVPSRVSVSRCPSLVNFVTGDSGFFRTAGDGAILTDDSGMLLEYPSAQGAVVIPEGIVSIYQYRTSPFLNEFHNLGSSPFYNNTLITSVTLPSSLTGIDGKTFAGCSNLAYFNISGNSNYMAKGNGALLCDTAGRLITWPSASGTVTLPSGVSVIGSFAFFNNLGITAIDFSNSPDLVTIEEGAFARCYEIISFDFSGCSSLREIGRYLSDSYGYFGKVEFLDLSGCTSLETIGGCVIYNWSDIPVLVKIDTAVPPVLPSGSPFVCSSGIPSNLAIQLPSNLYNAYVNAAGWSEYASKIENGSKWVRSAEGSAGAQFHATAADSGGNVYTVGWQIDSGIYDYGNGVTVAGGAAGNNAVIVKYNAEGKALWARSAGGSGATQFNGVAVDSAGNAIAVGNQYGGGSSVFGSTPVQGYCTGGGRVLVKYDSGGNVIWAKGLTSASGSSGAGADAVKLDSQNNIYVPGVQSGNVNYGNNVSVSGSYTVLVKYNDAGVAQWARSTAETSATLRDVALDENGNSYVVMGVTLVKYNASGVLQWTKAVSMSGNTYWEYISACFYSLAVYNGAVYVCGYIKGAGNFTFDAGKMIYHNFSRESAVIAKYSADNGTGLEVVTFRGDIYGNTQRLFSISVDASGVYAEGCLGIRMSESTTKAILRKYDHSLTILQTELEIPEIGYISAPQFNRSFLDSDNLYITGIQNGGNFGYFGVGGINGKLPQGNPVLLKMPKP